MSALTVIGGLLMLAQFVDLVTTYLVIKGGGYEVNPRLVWFAERLARLGLGRWAWLFVTKAACLAFYLKVLSGNVRALRIVRARGG